MTHLSLSPASAVDIDFEVFEFPAIELVTRSSGETLLMLVWSEGRKHLLFDRDVPREDENVIAEVRAEVARFNADRITGWREVLVAAYDQECVELDAERIRLSQRTRAVARARQDAGSACLRARHAAHKAATAV